jgi:hypothetical protein
VGMAEFKIECNQVNSKFDFEFTWLGCKFAP